MNNNFIVGIFDDEDKLVVAAKSFKKAGVKIHDIYTPFPVHGLDEVLDISRSRLPKVTFFAGLFGLILAIVFQIWTSAFAWPIDVGGKPMLSIPAFIPVAFEITILFGALTTVAAFFFRSRLFPSKEVVLLSELQTDYKFVLVLNSETPGSDLTKFDTQLKEYGALEVRVQN